MSLLALTNDKDDDPQECKNDKAVKNELISVSVISAVLIIVCMVYFNSISK